MKKKGLFYNLLGIFIILFHFLPIYITLMTSLKQKSDLSSRWLPPNYLNLDNFRFVLEDKLFFLAVRNTFLITICSSIIVILVGAMTGYVLARKKGWISSFMLMLTMGVMMVPTISLIVPLYKVMLTLQGINTFWGIILLISTQYLPISIIIYSNFIKSIPIDLDEAAEIDGCGKVSTFFRIILPQLGSVTTSVIILNGVKMFNEFVFALYFLQTPDKKMVTTYISSFFSEVSNLNVASAAALLAILPVVLVYLSLQKYFIHTSIESMGK